MLHIKKLELYDGSVTYVYRDRRGNGSANTWLGALFLVFWRGWLKRGI